MDRPELLAWLKELRNVKLSEHKHSATVQLSTYELLIIIQALEAQGKR